MNWFYSKDGQQVGPVAFTEIERLYSEGQLNDDSLIWQQGTTNWVKLSAARAAASEPVPAAVPAPAIPVAESAPAAAIPAAKGKTSGFAITSLVLGILGLICCSMFLVNIGAIAFGHLALNQLAKDPSLEGQKLAKVGLILGYVGLVLGVVVWILQIAFGVLNYAAPQSPTY